MESIYVLLGLEGRDLSHVDPNMLISALTHPSLSVDNYEAYEFIGDSVLSLVVSQVLYDMGIRSPDRMTKIRSLITKNSTLACIVVGSGLDKRAFGGIKLSEKAKADIFESIIGAIYIWAKQNLSNPILSIQKWLVEHWNIKDIISNIVIAMDKTPSGTNASKNKEVSTREIDIPLLSFMKTSEFLSLNDIDKRKHLLQEVELALNIRPQMRNELEKIKSQLLSKEDIASKALKNIKIRIYSIAMKESG